MQTKNTSLIPNGFLIICYNISNRFILGYNTLEYEKYYAEREGDTRNKIITKEEADRLIEKYRLKLVKRNEHGKIWA